MGLGLILGFLIYNEDEIMDFCCIICGDSGVDFWWVYFFLIYWI